MKKRDYWLIGSALIFTSAFIFLFAYKQNRFDTTQPIDASRFANFATFISGIMSIGTIILVYITFKQSQLTNKIGLKNSANTSFFNLFKAHQDIANYLHTQITTELRTEYEDLWRKNKGGIRLSEQKSFFELMYGILDLQYKKDGTHDRLIISAFFRQHDWIFGHYFRGLTYTIRWIHFDIGIPNSERTFYINFLRSHISLDEMRLTFYYVISLETAERLRMVHISHNRDFFNPVPEQLIYQDGEDSDWNYYLRLVNEAKQKPGFLHNR